MTEPTPKYTGDPNALDPSLFADSITGECLCGNIKLTLRQRDLFTKPNGHLCHCSNCRKSSGSVAANMLLVNQSAVTIDDPQALLKIYLDRDNASGRVAQRKFCSNCGSNICAIPTDSDEQYVLPLGIFPLIPQPEFELFAAHRHSWEGKLNGTTLYRYMTASGVMES